MISDRRQFIRDHTARLPVPLTPEISLHLADEGTALWSFDEATLEARGLDAPFWAFAWAGGQALARYILDRPELVRGKCVLDFASGSGIVAIAAGLSGAAHVTAVDIDPCAIAAIELNAELNGVSCQAVSDDVIGDRLDNIDVLLAGDVFYDPEMTAHVAPWFSDLSEAGRVIYVGDPGRSYLPREELVSVADYSVPVTRALEDFAIKNTRVWRYVEA